MMIRRSIWKVFVLCVFLFLANSCVQPNPQGNLEVGSSTISSQSYDAISHSTITIAVEDSWHDGGDEAFLAKVTLKNTGNEAIENWNVAFKSDTRIIQSINSNYEQPSTENNNSHVFSAGTINQNSVAVANTSAQDSYATVNNLEVEVLDLDPSILPKANFQVSATEGTVPFTVVFDAGLSVNGREYEWFFGDGATGEGIRVEHTFTTAGSHPVILQVRSGEHQNYVHTRIRAYANQGIAELPAYDSSDPLNFFKRNRQAVQNYLYNFGVDRVLDYTSIDYIRATLSFAWPGRESILYKKYNYNQDGVPQQSSYDGDYFVVNLVTGEVRNFESVTLRGAQNTAITSDSHYVIHGDRYGEIYIINTLTGEESLIFQPAVEGNADKMYDTLDVAVNPEGTEVIFVLYNIVSDGVGGMVSKLPHYVINLPITARNQTLASVKPLLIVPFGTKEFTEFNVHDSVWWNDRWYLLTDTSELREDVENEDLSRVRPQMNSLNRSVKPFQNDTRMLDDDFDLPPMSLPWSSGIDLSLSQGYMGDPKLPP